MKATAIALSSALSTALLLGGASPGATLQPQVLQALQESQRDVIVILRDQMANIPPLRRSMGARAAALAAAQGAVMAQLPNTGRKFHSFSTINAFATTVSSAEADTLAANPLVQAVVNDRVLKPPVRNTKAVKEASVGGSPASAATPDWSDNGLCNTLEPEALQLTHTAFADPSIPQAQRVRDGKGEFVTGKGVKVAFLADGLDPTLPGFTRPDGSPVFIDYADFTGDPAGTPTAGGEAFGDASSIAAQDQPKGKPLLFDISKFVNAAHPLPSPCNIRIRGMAPGASLVGLKVFSQINPSTTSNFVQAIEYAVVHDDVDVINESFGGNPYPDDADDPISLANEAAVTAGVTVVVSAGDGGSAGTLGSPSTESSVIESGATTQYRLYAQTVDSGMTFTKNLGYLDNNLSPFSSAGFAQLNARTVDAVAPGDSGWALCSTNLTLFTDCSNFTAAAGPAPIEDFGGTSESSPLTAGEAALIIQAYRSTHGGADPSPATVKRIIMSTATDLGAPAYEQGAGLINSLAAVQAALSVDGNGQSHPEGHAVLASPTRAAVSANPNTHQSLSFTFTNTGSTPQHLTPAVEALGAPFAGASVTLNLDPATDPAFLNVAGAPRHYIEYKFKVPAGADHLDAALAWPSPIGSASPPIAYLALIDPAGRLAIYSEPQGFGSGYGHVDVVKPSTGTWTAAIFTRPVGVSGTYTGPVHFTWGVENYEKAGSIWPASLTLAPGASQSVTAEFSMPSDSGDSSVAIKAEGFAEIPISLRTLVPVDAWGGKFTGTLTGGNGRAGVGPNQTFAFDVPKGVHDLNLSLEISDNGYLLEGLLVDPQGMELSVEPNQSPLDGSAQYALQLFHDNPQPGLWKFVLVQNYTSSGNQTSLPFKASIKFNSAQVSASGLPNDPSIALSASAAPVTVPIVLKNTGAATQYFFADARLDYPSFIELPTQTGACSGTVVTLPGYCGLWYLPTQVSTVAFVAQSPVSIDMDAFSDVGGGVGGTGSPDIYAKPVAPNTIAAILSEPEIPYSVWIAAPSLVGPYGPAGAPTEPVTANAYVLAKGFDSAVSADSGDLWADLTLNTATFNPLVLAPGQTGTIHVTITPDPTQVGNVVSGYIYIDTFNPVVSTGDEVVRIPYRYTVAK